MDREGADEFRFGFAVLVLKYEGDDFDEVVVKLIKRIGVGVSSDEAGEAFLSGKMPMRLLTLVANASSSLIFLCSYLVFPSSEMFSNVPDLNGTGVNINDKMYTISLIDPDVPLVCLHFT